MTETDYLLTPNVQKSRATGYVEWHLKRDWATLLFAEDDADDARARRAAPIKPAVKSQSAQRKAFDLLGVKIPMSSDNNQSVMRY